MSLLEDRQVGASIKPWMRGGERKRKRQKEACDFFLSTYLRVEKGRMQQGGGGRGYSQCGKQGEGAAADSPSRTYPEYQIEQEHHVLQAAQAAPGHVALLKF